MGEPPLPGHSGKRVDQGKRFQVQDVHASRRGDPQSSEAIFTALVDKVIDKRRVRLCRELDEGIAVVSDQAPAEGADPGVSLAVEIDPVDILVRKSALPGQSIDDQVVFRVRFGMKLSGDE